MFVIAFLKNLPGVPWGAWGERTGCHVCVFGWVGVRVVSAAGSQAGVTPFTPVSGITQGRSSIPSELSCPGALPNPPRGCGSHTPLSGWGHLFPAAAGLEPTPSPQMLLVLTSASSQ